MLNIPAIAQTQFCVFTSAQAGADGITMSGLKHAVASSELTRLRRGVYCATAELVGSHPADRRRHLAIRSAAAVLAEPGSVASHRSAASLIGSPILTIPDRPCITVQPRRHSTATGLHVHRAQFDVRRDVVCSSAIDRTSTSRMVTDIARECGVEEAVVVADAGLRSGRTDAPRLQRELEICYSWPGAQAARAAVALSSAKSESPLESVSRLRIGATYLPAPDLQVDITDAAGHFLGRGDFYWKEFGVIGEADGMEKYDGVRTKSLRQEKLRQERFENTGLIVVRWTESDLHQMARLVDRIAHALARGSRRLAADRRWIARESFGNVGFVRSRVA